MVELSTPYKLGIVGGCFPAQHNVAYESLFHQVLTRMLHEQADYSIEISIARYDQLNKGVARVQQLLDSGCCGIIFQVRPDPYLRLSKLLYKYMDSNKHSKHALALPQLQQMPSEQQTYHESVSPLYVPKQTSIGHAILRELNYCAGVLARTNLHALRQYESVVREVYHLCRKYNADIIILGAGSRPRTSMEQYLSWKLERRIRNSMPFLKMAMYVNIWGTRSETGEPLFFEDGMHVRPLGHIRVAERLYPAMLNYLQQFYKGSYEQRTHV